MNETIPPLPGGATSSRTSGLAVWSLVLGVLSLTCFTLFSAIPGVICGHKALSRIKQSGGTLTGQGLAIAGLVTGYLGILWAVIFLPLMLAIAIPNFVRARTTAQTYACLNNLRTIEAAKHEWALEHSRPATATPTRADLLPYFKNGRFPTCPAGGSYTINPVDQAPTCSIPNHKLPPG